MLTIAQYAARIAAKSGSVKRWIHEGMPVQRVDRHVRIDPAEADAWLRAHPRRSVTFNRQSFVYFAEREDGCIKIGFTSDVTRRVRELRRQQRIAVPRLLAFVEGDKRLELLFHRRFAASCVGGEWFARTPELVALVSVLSQRTEEAAA